MTHRLVAYLVGVLVFSVSCSTPTPKRQEKAMDSFRPGQVWQYKTRPGEESSRLIVCKVEEDDKLGTIVHLHVEGLKLKSPRSPDGLSRIIGHLPVAEAALRKSVTTLEGKRDPLPSYEEGYKMWREARDSGEAGVFTISLAEAVTFMEQILSR